MLLRRSALTSFLQEQGISAREIAERHRRNREAQQAAVIQAALDAANAEGGQSSSSVTATGAEAITVEIYQPGGGGSSSSSTGASSSLAGDPTAVDAASKRRKRKADDSDDDDTSGDEVIRASRRRGAPDDDDEDTLITCIKCRRSIPSWRFKGKSRSAASVCADCTAANLGKAGNDNETAKPKARGRGGRGAKGKPALASEYLILNETATVPSLQNICIKVVCDNIDLIESFGDIPEESLRQISRILSKHRRLTPELLPLFTGMDRHALHLYDCTQLVPDVLATIAPSCPALSDLHLSFCGRMADDVIVKYADTWEDGLLRKVHLTGPFLVCSDAWIYFMTKVGGQLSELYLEYASKLDHTSLKALADASTTFNSHMGSGASPLRKLSLLFCDLLDAACIEQICRLTCLESLELCHSAPFLKDEHVQSLVAALPHLESLSLSNCPLLTDVGLTAIAQLPHLRRLALNLIPELTAEGMREFVRVRRAFNVGPTDRFTHLDVSRCDGLNSDDALVPLLAYAAPSLTHLAINRMDKLSPRVFVVLTQRAQEARDQAPMLLPMPGAEAAPPASAEGPPRKGRGRGRPRKTSQPAPPPLPPMADDSSDLTGSLLQECDLGWVRCVDDDILESLVSRCSHLRVLRVFGCYKVTECSANKTWINGSGEPLRLIGTEF
ncbi:UV-damaged DNA-binding protein rad7 [Sorochytrium milnesiophthora]